MGALLRLPADIEVFPCLDDFRHPIYLIFGEGSPQSLTVLGDPGGDNFRIFPRRHYLEPPYFNGP